MIHYELDSIFYPVKFHGLGDDKNYDNDFVSQDVRTKFRTVKSLSRLCMENILKYPELIEDICPVLPQHLRKDLASLGFKRIKEPTFQHSSLMKLFYTWSEERINVWQLSNKHRNVFGVSLKVSPWSIFEEDNYFKRTVIETVLELVVSKIICIKSNSSKAVKMIDFTGFSLLGKDLERLISARFTKSEKTTVLLDADASDDNISPTKMLRILHGNDHIDFKIKFLTIDGSVREPIRNKFLELCNDLDGLNFSAMEFEDWPALYRCLTPIMTKCPNLSKLSLSENNLFDENTGDQAGRLWINKFLKSFKNLTRLDISLNNLNDRVSDILEGLRLQFLNVSNCELSEKDVEFVFSLKSLVHLDLSNNLYLDSTKIEPNNTIEILNLTRCNIGLLHGTTFKLFSNFLKKMHGLKYLDISNNKFSTSQLSTIIDFKFQQLKALNVLTDSCQCGANCVNCHLNLDQIENNFESNNYDYVYHHGPLSISPGYSAIRKV